MISAVQNGLGIGAGVMEHNARHIEPGVRDIVICRNVRSFPFETNRAGVDHCSCHRRCPAFKCLRFTFTDRMNAFASCPLSFSNFGSTPAISQAS